MAPVPPRQRVERVVALWGVVTLVGVAILGLFVVWHLVRRGRLVRDRLGHPRIVQWPELPDRGPEP